MTSLCEDILHAEEAIALKANGRKVTTQQGQPNEGQTHPLISPFKPSLLQSRDFWSLALVAAGWPYTQWGVVTSPSQVHVPSSYVCKPTVSKTQMPLQRLKWQTQSLVSLLNVFFLSQTMHFMYGTLFFLSSMTPGGKEKSNFRS